MTLIERVKILLGIEDDLQDKLLEQIEMLTTEHFKAYTGADAILTEFEYIIVEVMIKRFNRIGSEGYARKGIEGLSLTFQQSDFDEYDKILKSYYRDHFTHKGFKLL